jgi:phosphoglycerate dehydrogenase-like enzyme
MPRISIPDDSPPVLAPSAVFPALRARAELDYHDTLPGSEDVLTERIRAAEVVLNIRASSRFTARVFAACPRLRLLSVWGTGTDHVDLASAAQHGVAVTNTPAVSARSIAEHALALLFAVVRRIPEMDAATRLGTWPRGRAAELYGKTCGVVGYGAVGRHFARLAEAVGMRVIVWTLHPAQYAGVSFVELDEIYRTSDVVSLHLRLSPQTECFVNAAQFAIMKPNAILINTARGAIVHEEALLNALATGRIAGAGLDVFTTEPLPRRHPLTLLDNVVLTPHCAGITPEALEAGLRMAVDNIWDFLEGRPQNLVGGNPPASHAPASHPSRDH